jgi:ABC-type sugar transport system ATPase subunit
VLAQVGDPRQVYDDPVDLPTAEFIGDTCILPAVISGDIAHGALGEVPVRRSTGHGRFDGPAILMLRPEQLSIRPVESAPGGVAAAVTSVEYFGHDCIITAELSADALSPPTTLTCRLLAGERLSPGDAVAISVNGSALAFPALPPAEAPADTRERIAQ